MSNIATMSPRRTPQQQRGELRLAQLLEAAASVIAEVGYDAATMTAFAARANASIGTLYQYFPDKEAVARTLRQQYAAEIEVLWLPLITQASKLSIRRLADRIIDIIVDYIGKRPAYIPLLNAPLTYKRDPGVRNRLRGHFAAMFLQKRPGMTREAAFRAANVTAQLLKGMNALYAETRGAEREAIVPEFKLLLTSYLSARFKAG